MILPQRHGSSIRGPASYRDYLTLCFFFPASLGSQVYHYIWGSPPYFLFLDSACTNATRFGIAQMEINYS